MNVDVSDIKIEVYYQYVSDFTRRTFDADQLAEFLNEQRAKTVQSAKKWNVEKDEERSDRVTIEDAVLDTNSGLLVERFVIGDDSILMIALQKGRTLTEADEQPKDWPEIQQIRRLLAEFFSLNEDDLNNPKALSRSLYLTRMLGIQFPIKFEELLRPEFKEFLERELPVAYAERGMDIDSLHPYNIEVKVNTKPSADAMQSLESVQLRNLISRENWEISVQTLTDYDEMLFRYESRLPFHQHVRTLRALADLAKDLAS